MSDECYDSKQGKEKIVYIEHDIEPAPYSIKKSLDPRAVHKTNHHIHVIS